MSDSARTSHPSKRAMVVTEADNSTIEQPVAKKAAEGNVKSLDAFQFALPKSGFLSKDVTPSFSFRKPVKVTEIMEESEASVESESDPESSCSDSAREEGKKTKKKTPAPTLGASAFSFKSAAATATASDNAQPQPSSCFGQRLQSSFVFGGVVKVAATPSGFRSGFADGATTKPPLATASFTAAAPSRAFGGGGGRFMGGFGSRTSATAETQVFGGFGSRTATTSNHNRSLVAIDGDNSANGQPTVKKAAEPVFSQEALEIHQKLIKLDNHKQGAIRIAGELQARVEFLEHLVDQKPARVDDTNKKLAEELQKKVHSLTKELDEEKSTAKEDRLKYYEKVHSLMKQQEEEKSQAKEEQLRDRAKIEELKSHRNELANQLAAAGDSEKILRTELLKKIDELTNNRNELARKLAEAGNSEKKLMEEQQKKIDDLSQTDGAQKKLAGEQQKKIEELTRKLTQYESEQQEQLVETRINSEDSSNTQHTV